METAKERNQEMKAYLKFSLWSAAVAVAAYGGWWHLVTALAVFGITSIVMKLRLSKKETELVWIGDVPKGDDGDTSFVDTSCLCDPETEKRIAGKEKTLQRIDSWEHTLLLVFCILAGFSLLCGAFRVAMYEALLNLIPACVCEIIARVQKERFQKACHAMERRRDALLLEKPRPYLWIGDTRSQSRICRLFETEKEARIAWGICCLAEFDFMIYPRDFFPLACGGRYPQVKERLEKIFQMTVRPVTFGKLVREVAARQNRPFPKSAKDVFLPVGTASAPPLSARLARAYDPLHGSWSGINALISEEEMKARPEFSEIRFCSYWRTREEAAAALSVRGLLVEAEWWDADAMCYPNDPMLLFFCRIDSMDDVEFVMEIEEHFGISIPDGECEILNRATFGDFVAYLLDKQKQQVSYAGKEKKNGDRMKS